MTDPLHYDTTGNGPVLLLVPGGAGHPMGLGPLTERLAQRFTVVTYDPLGLTHGRLGRPVPDQRPAHWSDGAHRVLETVLPPGERAHVFGTSSGGIAVLDLFARHPGRLAHVVAHEPPCVTLLPDGAHERADLIERLTAGQRASAEDGPPSPIAVFLAHVLRPFTAYTPAFSAPTGLTVAAGADSRGQVLHRTAQAVAQRTGSPFTEFPGGHLGTLEHPVAFADRLTQTLLAADAPGAAR
ncbi:alpha/beta fold hydrolase [Streptomyces griseochromogenes]|uniref:alpha/beta fold hydrolase n=1 Tax=Streptomyces griseochromogenes TaxID=68214 RepID=UPI00379D5B28